MCELDQGFFSTFKQFETCVKVVYIRLLLTRSKAHSV